MKANFGILPQIEFKKKTGKRERYSEYSKRSLCDLASFIASSESTL
jgi:folate-dependent tRNA-U54 methylase TrmFO/GidA